MGIIALLLVAIVPAVNSLSKSSGRKAAIGNLLGAIEQARAQAIKDGQATYIVFPDQLPATVQRYSYRSYAIFEDDPSNAANTKQLTPWRSLPNGISLRSGSLNYLANTTSFSFTPMGAKATGLFPFLKFNANGEIDPATTRTPNAPGTTIQVGVFEGHVDSGSDKETNSSKITETISVSRLTGRATKI
jgi:type II secretory pathway pseudopilin PulG